MAHHWIRVLYFSPPPRQVNAIVKVTVRSAVPLGQTVGVSPADKVFSRAVSPPEDLDLDLDPDPYPHPDLGIGHAHVSYCTHVLDTRSCFQLALLVFSLLHVACIRSAQVFMMDYRDSDLFHVLEDLVRRNRAVMSHAVFF